MRREIKGKEIDDLMTSSIFVENNKTRSINCHGRLPEFHTLKIPFFISLIMIHGAAFHVKTFNVTRRATQTTCLFHTQQRTYIQIGVAQLG